MPAGRTVVSDVEVQSATATRLDPGTSSTRIRVRVQNPEPVTGTVVLLGKSADEATGAAAERADPQFGGLWEAYITEAVPIYAYHEKGSSITVRLIEYCTS